MICTQLGFFGHDNKKAPFQTRAIAWISDIILLIGTIWSNWRTIGKHSRNCHVQSFLDINLKAPHFVYVFVCVLGGWVCWGEGVHIGRSAV